MNVLIVFKKNKTNIITYNHLKLLSFMDNKKYKKLTSRAEKLVREYRFQRNLPTRGIKSKSGVGDEHWARLLALVGEWKAHLDIRWKTKDGEDKQKKKMAEPRYFFPNNISSEQASELLRAIARVYLFLCPTPTMLDICQDLCKLLKEEYVSAFLIVQEDGGLEGTLRGRFKIGYFDLLKFSQDHAAIMDYACYGVVTTFAFNRILDDGCNFFFQLRQIWLSKHGTTLWPLDFSDPFLKKSYRKIASRECNWLLRHGDETFISRKIKKSINDFWFSHSLSFDTRQIDTTPEIPEFQKDLLLELFIARDEIGSGEHVPSLTSESPEIINALKNMNTIKRHSHPEPLAFDAIDLAKNPRLFEKKYLQHIDRD